MRLPIHRITPKGFGGKVAMLRDGQVSTARQAAVGNGRQDKGVEPQLGGEVLVESVGFGGGGEGRPYLCPALGKRRRGGIKAVFGVSAA